MSDADAIWRLGRWLGAGRSGTVRISWGSGEAVLRIKDRRLVGLEGLDPRCVAGRLGANPEGNADLFVEAREIARRKGIQETRALTAVKGCLEEALVKWLLDPDREVSMEEGEASIPDGPAISLDHVMVELLLAGEEPALPRKVLPDEKILLRRGPAFLTRYAALQLAQEADLVVAKITESRTAAELIARSPHPEEDVRRLLAALIAAGLLEPVPVAEPEPEEILFRPDQAGPPEPVGRVEPTVRMVSWRWLALAGLVLVGILTLAVFWFRHQPPPTPGQRVGVSWGVVVDMGCEAVDYERILRKVRKHPRTLRAIRTAPEEGKEGDCWRLVWGRYASRDEAERAVETVPADMLTEGFEPHVVELGRDEDVAEEATDQ